MTEYHATTPATEASARSSAARLPVLKGDLRVTTPRLGDHPRREVDAADVEAQGLQVPGDPAGAAADVDNRATALEVDELGEVPQQGTVERAAGELVSSSRA